MTPSPLGPCRKEVFVKGDIPSLIFFEGALRAPLGPPDPGTLAPATPSLGGPVYLYIFNGFRVIRCLSQCVSPKIAIFTTFWFPLGTPMGQSH